jgi:hypothetical protein
VAFTDITDYAIVADLRCGANDAPFGQAEVGLGSSPDDETSARLCWDTDLSDGFDSGWVRVEFDVSVVDGTVSAVWCVKGVEVTFDDPVACDQILGFMFRSGVCASGATASFRNVSGEFFATASATAPSQTVYVDDASATTAGADAPDDAEAIVTVAAEGSGFQKAKLFAEVRIDAPTLPAPCDLFAQAFLFTA